MPRLNKQESAAKYNMVGPRWVRSAVTASLLLWVPAQAAAQSCSLCYTQAAAAGQKLIEALRSGILILIIPPTLMTIGMIFVAHRKQYDTRAPQEELPQDGKWQTNPGSEWWIGN